MEPSLLTLILFTSLIIGLASGVPIAFALAAVGAIFTLLMWGPHALIIISATAYSKGTDFVLVALPLFVLMAEFLKESGVADDLFEAMHVWFARMPGGLASGTVVACAIFAAISGISGVAAVTLGLIAIPAMLQRGYDKRLVVGTVGAGAALGVLIPPSIIAIIFGAATGVSIGKLFIGGVLPGILLSTMFIMYITTRTMINPHLGPPSTERFSWREKVFAIKKILYPFLLIILVLVSIYTGMCTPTESAAIGTLGSFLICIFQRRMNKKNMLEALLSTLRVTSMAMWIVFGAACFSQIYTGLGASDFILALIVRWNPSPMVVIWIMMFIYIILGCFLDPAGMCLITVPIFAPIIVHLGFDMLWFGILFIVNTEMAYITPPFGFNLFYLKGVVPPSITMQDIYGSVFPFVCVQFCCLILVVYFPFLATWLPNTM
jgi:tripartite ATP-independent transporter DctM subunit